MPWGIYAGGLAPGTGQVGAVCVCGRQGMEVGEGVVTSLVGLVNGWLPKVIRAFLEGRERT